jgi:hypothetical protein
MNVTGTLRVNKKRVPEEKKQAKLKKGEHTVTHSHGVMVLKWTGKRHVTLISTLHYVNIVSMMRRGKEVKKPKCIQE